MRRFLQMVDAGGKPTLPGSVAKLTPGGQPWPPQTPGHGVVKELGPEATGRRIDPLVLWYEWVVDRATYTLRINVQHSQPNLAAHVHPSVVGAINRSATYEAKRA